MCGPDPEHSIGFNSLFALRWSSTTATNETPVEGAEFQFALCAEVVFDWGVDVTTYDPWGEFQFALCAEVVFDCISEAEQDEDLFQFALCAEVVFDTTPSSPTTPPTTGFNSLFALRWSSTAKAGPRVDQRSVVSIRSLR